MAEFEGVYPAIITPMTKDGELNEAAFREVIEFNIEAGVHGFWVAGGTGEACCSRTTRTIVSQR